MSGLFNSLFPYKRPLCCSRQVIWFFHEIYLSRFLHYKENEYKQRMSIRSEWTATHRKIIIQNGNPDDIKSNTKRQNDVDVNLNELTNKFHFSAQFKKHFHAKYLERTAISSLAIKLCCSITINIIILNNKIVYWNFDCATLSRCIYIQIETTLR